jgi:hypothetical protein
MKIRKSAAYALHALMYMVRHNTQLPATTATIAKAEGIPLNYLAKIFQQLVKAHLIKAVKSRIEVRFQQNPRLKSACLSCLKLLKEVRYLTTAF